MGLAFELSNLIVFFERCGLFWRAIEPSSLQIAIEVIIALGCEKIIILARIKFSNE